MPEVPYTLLRATEQGVVLAREHANRFAPAGSEAWESFWNFTRDVTPGIYALTWQDRALRIETRPGSRLEDGMPVRFLPSPFARFRGRFPKPAPPSPYDAVRRSGICTLLCTADGDEILEACSAAVVSWDGGVLLPPYDRPAVRSVAEEAIRQAIPFREEPLLRDSRLPLAVVNAVKGICRIDAPGRPRFPEEGARLIEAVFRASREPGVDLPFRVPGPD